MDRMEHSSLLVLLSSGSGDILNYHFDLCTFKIGRWQTYKPAEIKHSL